MRCPFCGHDETQVKDSRPSEDNSSIRRRRQCPACAARFTTFERVQLRELMVIKKDESRTVFDREKLLRSINISCRKRPVNTDQIELITNSIQRRLESSGETEIPTKVIGELVMEVMKEMAEKGLQNSLSDAGVGALCARTAVIGAYFNVRINAKDIKDRSYAEGILNRAKKTYEQTILLEQDIIAVIDTKI